MNNAKVSVNVNSNVGEKIIKTPIEIALGIGEDGKTTARKLYEFLEMDASNYSRWIKSNILENPFAEKNIDYEVFRTNAENSKGKNSSSMTSLTEKPKTGRGNTQDFKLSANFAKKLCMQGKTEKAEQAREYFIKIEDKLKEIAKNKDVKPEIVKVAVSDDGIIIKEVQKGNYSIEDMLHMLSSVFN